MKKIERRQGDVVEALNYGIPAIMTLVPEIDLKFTPQLCDATQSYLDKYAQSMRIRNREPYPYEAGGNLNASFVGVRWFVAKGCNCDEGIAAIETVAHTYLDSPERKKLLAELEGLRQAR